MSRRRLEFSKSIVALLLTVALCVNSSTSQSVAQESLPVEPTVAAASDEAIQQLANFRLPKGWKASVWAAEPLVANPVAFAIDDLGRIYLCESFRQEQGVTDNRSHDDRWVDRDLASRTVADRIAYHEELLPNRGADYRRQEDRVRRLIDEDQDGVADRSEIFANHFHSLEDGTLAGVLPIGDEVWLTNIPHLWRLKDTDGDGRAEVRESIQAGFGVRVAFRGHDMHGLIRGPDGRIYFSIGDRGYHLQTSDGRLLADSESGAVFRCEPDGSRLEVVATGLRNPQELAFDSAGNLFTGDNNSDSGDRARWVYVLTGADSGWRMAYQYLPDRGPFNRERIWEPLNSDQPAYILPPVANVADGPSGLLYYPGTGVGSGLEQSFLLCDFRGTPSMSGIRRVKLEPAGAFFKLQSADELVWQILATDCAIGPDGWLYVSDWVNGWVGENKGRIYRLADSEAINQPEVSQVAERLEKGFSGESVETIAGSLGHIDQRIRLAAQFELVRRRAGATLRTVAISGNSTLSRLHGIWGSEQLARETGQSENLSFFEQLLADSDPEVRAQVAKAAGDQKLTKLIEPLAAMIRDRSQPRVQLFAALAFRQLTHPRPEELLDELSANADRDPALRHGLVMALAGQELSKLVSTRRETLDLAAARSLVVALRKQRNPAIAEFLSSPLVQVAEEAARAIYDLPMEDCLPSLAAAWNLHPASEVFTRRALCAAYRLGGEAEAGILAMATVDSQVSGKLRSEVVELFSTWAKPNPRDQILGMWRPIEPRDSAIARAAFSEVAARLLVEASDELRMATVQTVANLKIKSAEQRLLQLADTISLPGKLRAGCVRALGELGTPALSERLIAWAEDFDPSVRTAVMEVLAAQQPDLALQVVQKATRSSDLRERQAAWRQLGLLRLAGVTSLLQTGLEQLDAGKIPPDTRLDLVEAVRSREESDLSLRQWLATYDSRGAADPISKYRDSLLGGNAERGRVIFKEWANVSCLRCHRVGEDGGYVGPNLSDIGVKKDRQYLLESIVDPNRAIAEKYETTVVLDLDGKTYSGIVNFEDEKTLRLLTAEGEMTTIDKEQIEERTTGKSAMPADLVKYLSPFDVRDLVEFLAQQQAVPGGPAVESLERSDQ